MAHRDVHPTQPAFGGRQPPGLKEWMEARLAEELGWYDARARKNQRWYRAIKVLQPIVAALGQWWPGSSPAQLGQLG